MSIFLSNIENNAVYPVRLINEGNVYLTLYYYTKHEDALLHDEKHIIYFENTEDMKRFCKEASLETDACVSEVDFDIPTVSPTDCNSVLNNCNMLNTVSNSLKIYFDGNNKKYNALYTTIFHNSMRDTAYTKNIFFDSETNKKLLKVFRRKKRLLDRFIIYRVE